MTLEELQAHLKSGTPIKSLKGMPRLPSPKIQCADGFQLSVQASASHYCTPRDNDGPYTHVEVGYPTTHDDRFGEYEGDGIYSYVPIENVLAVINDHGGVA